MSSINNNQPQRLPSYGDAKSIVEAGKNSSNTSAARAAERAQDSFNTVNQNPSASTARDYVHSMVTLAQQQGFDGNNVRDSKEFDAALRSALSGARVGSSDISQVLDGAYDRKPKSFTDAESLVVAGLRDPSTRSVAQTAEESFNKLNKAPNQANAEKYVAAMVNLVQSQGWGDGSAARSEFAQTLTTAMRGTGLSQRDINSALANVQI